MYRAAQLRYTTGPLSISVEEALSYSGLIESNDPDPTTGGRRVRENESEKESLPLLAARYEDSIGALSYSTAAFLRNVGYDDGVNDDNAVGYGAFGALTFAVTDSFTLRGAINYEMGAGAYVYRSGENFAAVDGYVDNNGDLQLIGGYGGTIGMSLAVGPGSVNVGYGFARVNWDDAEDDLGAEAVADRHETNSMLLANYQWSPTKSIILGVEYGYLKVKEVGGSDGDANRIQLVTQYNF